MIECCCDNCCDEVGGPPNAAFSYEQTSDDPCTINLHDESTPGTCGSIISYSWKKNGVEFSTASDPTGVVAADGDDIELTVADVAGCTDAAVMEIDCVSGMSCQHCPELVPETASATLAIPAQLGCDCVGLNGRSFDLVAGSPEVESCCWDGDEGAGAYCGDGNEYADCRVCITETAIIANVSYLVTGPPTNMAFSLARDPEDSCRGTFVLPRIPWVTGWLGTSGDESHCDGGTLTVTI